MSPRPMRIALDEGWTVEPLDGSGVPPEVRDAGRIPARVPGVVHTDLLAAGLIADPLRGTNERLQEWIGSTSWRYFTEFEWVEDAEDRTDLVLEGLDTVATVTLNGVVVLESRDQHRSFRVPVRRLMRSGRNQLQIDFAAPVPAADRASVELGYRPHVNHHPYNAIRKMACSFGWDWGPDTATSGIWRPVWIESWSGVRLAEVRTVPSVEGGHGRVVADLTVERTRAGTVDVVVTVGDARAEAVLDNAGDSVRIELDAGAVELWWPVGHGAQPLHNFTATAIMRDSNRLDAIERRIGFRTVELDLSEDAEGTAFGLRINGRAIFAKGVNWIPDDPFPHRISDDRYRQRLEQARDANINLVRVWGGGIYESESFYRAADELGLLVWQDFLFACAAYSEDEPLAAEVRAEAREAVVRLAAHPSLVVLNGNNENLWGHEAWGWVPQLDGRTWGAGYYYELLPELVNELAPHVAYTPGSPFSPDPADFPNDERTGSMHIWDLWNERDYPEYRSYRPRFVAEFGWQSPPNWSTLTDALDDAPLTPESPGMLVHQKAANGNVKLIDGLVTHLSLPEAMPDWHFAMQLNQANAVTVALEHFRSLAPHCQGAVVWQLNDCWPVVSWAAIDGAGRPKPLLHAIAKAFAPRLVTIQPSDGGLVVVIANDNAETLDGHLEVERLSYDGSVLATSSVYAVVPPYGTVSLPVPDEVATSKDDAAELVRAALGSLRGLWFFAEYRHSALHAPNFLATAAQIPGGVQVTVRAAALVRDLTLLADIVDPAALANEQLITLLPGEVVTVFVSTEETADLDRFLAPHVLRSANQLVSGFGSAAVGES